MQLDSFETDSKAQIANLAIGLTFLTILVLIPILLCIMITFAPFTKPINFYFEGIKKKNYSMGLVHVIFMIKRFLAVVVIFEFREYPLV